MEERERKLINRLIVGISNNREKDLEQLFHMTKNQLYFLTRKYISDPELIQKILSVGYLEIYRRSYHFDSKKMDGFEWVCKIVEEIAINIVKKN